MTIVAGVSRAKSKSKQPTRLPLQKKLGQHASGISVGLKFISQ